MSGFHHRQYDREVDLQNRARDFIKNKYGPDVWYLKTNDRFRKGIPDIILCFFGMFVAIELKGSNGALTPLQDHNIRLIRRANGFAFEARTIDQIDCALAKILTVLPEIKAEIP